MSTRATILIAFYFQKQHYAQLQAFIPYSEASAIPSLKLSAKTESKSAIKLTTPSSSKAKKNKVEKDFEEDNSSADDCNNNNIPDQQIESLGLMDQLQKEMQKAQLQQPEQSADQEEIQDQLDQDQDEDEELDVDMSSLSNQLVKNSPFSRTKRQRGCVKDLVELPDRRLRKNNKSNQAIEIARKEQVQRKRKQYLKKQIQAQEKATLDKILNETGRKLRMREQKEIQQEMQRETKVYKTLGDVPKIITRIDQAGKTIIIHNTKLFSEEMTTAPDLKMKQLCSNCGNQSKYKLKNTLMHACSVGCYKILKG